jgi:hypothetical protein
MLAWRLKASTFDQKARDEVSTLVKTVCWRRCEVRTHHNGDDGDDTGVHGTGSPGGPSALRGSSDDELGNVVTSLLQDVVGDGVHSTNSGLDAGVQRILIKVSSEPTEVGENLAVAIRKRKENCSASKG